MAEATADQVRRYILDGSDDDLRRLLSLSESFAEHARRALRRVGVGPGWTVIDCGCGPIGGLAILAEMVGPAGRVVGVDFSEPTIQYARTVMAALGLENVELVAGDIHELDAKTLGGPFDLAFTRAFLMHQADPVRTLSRIAGLVRPGGWIIPRGGSGDRRGGRLLRDSGPGDRFRDPRGQSRGGARARHRGGHRRRDDRRRGRHPAGRESGRI
jgi:SAM-dependent methyltransferase